MSMKLQVTRAMALVTLALGGAACAGEDSSQDERAHDGAGGERAAVTDGALHRLALLEQLLLRSDSSGDQRSMPISL